MQPSIRSSVNAPASLDPAQARQVWDRLVEIFLEVWEEKQSWLEGLSRTYSLPDPGKLAMAYKDLDPVQALQSLFQADPQLSLSTVLRYPPDRLAEDMLLSVAV